MRPRIDLEAYSKEVDAFERLAGKFVDQASGLRLEHVAGELKRHVRHGRRSFRWFTREPIRFEPSRSYDSPVKTNLPEAWFSLSFDCAFTRPNRAPDTCTVWELEESAVHVQIDRAEEEPLLFHFDTKTSPQWGPQLHFQVHESIRGLAVPRILANVFLPTDCADLMLNELHQRQWQAKQGKFHSQHDVAELRNGQEYRTRCYLDDIAAQWKPNDSLTRVSMLQSYTAKVKALPDARNVVKATAW